MILVKRTTLFFLQGIFLGKAIDSGVLDIHRCGPLRVILVENLLLSHALSTVYARVGPSSCWALTAHFIEARAGKLVPVSSLIAFLGSWANSPVVGSSTVHVHSIDGRLLDVLFSGPMRVEASDLIVRITAAASVKWSEAGLWRTPNFTLILGEAPTGKSVEIVTLWVAWFLVLVVAKVSLFGRR